MKLIKSTLTFKRASVFVMNEIQIKLDSNLNTEMGKEAVGVSGVQDIMYTSGRLSAGSSRLAADDQMSLVQVDRRSDRTFCCQVDVSESWLTCRLYTHRESHNPARERQGRSHWSAGEPIRVSISKK